MDEESPVNPFSPNLDLWFFIVAMIVGVFALTASEAQNPIQSIPETPITRDVKIHSSLQVKPADNIKEKSSPLPPGDRKERLFHEIIIKAAGRHRVDPALVKAIIMAESGYNPRAISKKGAMGLMQLMPRTAEALGLKDTLNPEHNINAGVKYFKQLLGQFEGDVKLALAAYNAGTKKVKQYKGIPPFKSTQYYVKKVFDYYQHFKKEMAGETDNV